MALPTTSALTPDSFTEDHNLLRAILSSAVTHGASDIHIRADAHPALRVGGELWPIEMDP